LKSGGGGGGGVERRNLPDNIDLVKKEKKGTAHCANRFFLQQNNF